MSARHIPRALVAIGLLASVALAQPAPDAVEPASPRSLSELERKLEAADLGERKLRTLDADLALEEKAARQRILLRGRRYAQMARAGLMPVGGGFDALVAHANRLEKLRRSLARDMESEKTAVRQRAVVRKKLDALKSIAEPLRAQRTAMAGARAALLAQEDRALAFQRAFDSSFGGAHTTIYGTELGPSDPNDVATGFAAMRGRLPFPIAGRAEIRSGRRGTGGPGLEMVAPRGTPVRAVFPGRVGFADQYAEYGRTVIIDHGGSHFTVSANLGEIAVKVGDEVDTGARVGGVGDDGTGRPVLYFEIRVSSETVDPAEWFGI